MTDDTIRVLLADDNRVVRRGLRLRLDRAADITVVAEATNGTDAVSLARTERADVVLMDIQMPGLDGLSATRELLADHQHPVAVIVMTSYAVDHYVLDALDAGAVGYLLKGHDSDQLLVAIRAAARGEALLSTRVTTPLLKELKRTGPLPGDNERIARLTPAERRVVAALAQGITSNEGLADHLGLSVHTVRSQLQAVLKKTELEDRTQVALWGARNRFASLS